MMARRVDIIAENEITRSSKIASPELLQLCCQDSYTFTFTYTHTFTYTYTYMAGWSSKVKTSVGEISFIFFMSQIALMKHFFNI